MSNLIEFSGEYFAKEGIAVFQVVLQMPQLDPSSGDYLCRVVSNQLFTRYMDVYGTSRGQAIRLALSLVQEALTSLVLTEEEMASDV